MFSPLIRAAFAAENSSADGTTVKGSEGDLELLNLHFAAMF
ncbi:MAG TPA: hypothetical protein VJL58_01730 [Pyrinomonadaceae bacterium]|nr:hypothetical protein [Pyrinomonadaceae bacterium]